MQSEISYGQSEETSMYYLENQDLDILNANMFTLLYIDKQNANNLITTTNPKSL